MDVSSTTVWLIAGKKDKKQGPSSLFLSIGIFLSLSLSLAFFHSCHVHPDRQTDDDVLRDHRIEDDVHPIHDRLVALHPDHPADVLVRFPDRLADEGIFAHPTDVAVLYFLVRPTEEEDVHHTHDHQKTDEDVRYPDQDRPTEDADVRQTAVPAADRDTNGVASNQRKTKEESHLPKSKRNSPTLAYRANSPKRPTRSRASSSSTMNHPRPRNRVKSGVCMCLRDPSRLTCCIFIDKVLTLLDATERYGLRCGKKSERH